MSYYEEVKKANQFIDDEISSRVVTNGEKININNLSLTVTSEYAVSQSTLNKRLETHFRIGLVKLEGDFIVRGENFAD